MYKCVKCFFTTLGFILGFSGLVNAQTYEIDTAHTDVVWFASHFGFSDSSGEFTDVTGTITLDEANPEDSQAKIIIDINSVKSGVEKLDIHLKAKDFFYTEKYPEAIFVSTKATKTGENQGKLYGKLTMRGLTKDIVFDVKLNKKGPNPMSSKQTVGFSLTGTVKRSQFGINYGLPAISDDVKLIIEAEAIQK